MRILYFTRDYTAHDYRFLNALSQTEHEVYSLRLERRGVQREDRPLPSGVTQVLWQGGKKPVERNQYWQLRRALQSVLKQVQPDVVHAGSIQTAALLAAKTGMRSLVSMSWGYDMLMDADSSKRMRNDTRFTLDHSAALVCDCDAVREKAIAYGFPENRIVQFPWGTDLIHFSPDDREADRKRLGWKPEDFVILSLRAWEPIYDVATVVKGFIQAVRQEPALRLALLGGGSQQNELRQLLMNAGVMEQVYFGGKAGFEELPSFYRSADLYASASLTDGSSVSLLEALACGTPALVSLIPGNLEWVKEDQNGWFFPVGDVETCAQKMITAYQQREQLVTMRKNARMVAEERANWKLNFPKLFTAYQTAMEQ